MSSRRYPVERRSHASVYVGNLPDNVTEGEVEDLLYKYGRIRDIDVKRGRSANGTAYAFVEFDHPRDAEDAVERSDGISYAGQRLRVEFTGDKKPKRRDGFAGPPQRSEYRVIVTGIPQGCRWQHLKDHMRKAGEVGYANVDHGLQRGIVEYLNRDDMHYALTKLDGTDMQAFHTTTRIRVKQDVGGGVERSSDYRDTSRRRSRSRSRERDVRGRSMSPDQRRRSASHDRRRRDEGYGRYDQGGRRSVSRSRSEYRDNAPRDGGKGAAYERRNGSYERTGRGESPNGGSEGGEEGRRERPRPVVIPQEGGGDEERRRMSGSVESRPREEVDPEGEDQFDCNRLGRGSDEMRDYYDGENRMKYDGNL